MKWPWSRPEVRSANYTDQVISQILSSAGGAGDGGALAAIEASARLWGSGLASATVKPSNIALARRSRRQFWTALGAIFAALVKVFL